MASPESILQTIQNYIRSLDSKKGKDVAMTPTGAVTTPKEDILPGGGSSVPQDTIPKPNYPDAPKRTVAPITDDIPTAGTSASLAASTAAKMLQQQRNLEAMNEETEQKGWYEQMRDASDVYKADIGLDRDKKRYDYMMERDAAKAALEAEKIAQRGDIASDRAAIEREKITSREAIADKRLKAAETLRANKGNSAFEQAYIEKITELTTPSDPQDSSSYTPPTQEQVMEAVEYAKLRTGRAHTESDTAKKRSATSAKITEYGKIIADERSKYNILNLGGGSVRGTNKADGKTEKDMNAVYIKAIKDKTGDFDVEAYKKARIE